MNLDEYLWRHKITAVDFAKKVDCSPNTIGLIKKNKHSPGAFLARKMMIASDGKLDLAKMMSKKDKNAYEKWMCD